MNHFATWALAIGLVATLPLDPMHRPQDPAVAKLATERYDAAKAVWERVADQPVDTLHECDSRATWSRRLAESAAASGALTTREAFTQHLARMQDILAANRELLRAGRRTAAGVACLEYHVAEAKGLVPR